VIEPLRLSFEVACPMAHAFTVWTSGIGTWWPADHTVSGEPNADVVLERWVGGRIYERTPDGTVHEWGQVSAWEPPDRLAYSWFIRTDRSDATDVEIRFVRVDSAATRVEITHTGWERLGSRGPAWRERNHGGWSTLLPHYQSAVTRAAD
jgi:uncharacterized protein YndB with AHSA1/START domain